MTTDRPPDVLTYQVTEPNADAMQLAKDRQGAVVRAQALDAGRDVDVVTFDVVMAGPGLTGVDDAELALGALGVPAPGAVAVNLADGFAAVVTRAWYTLADEPHTHAADEPRAGHVTAVPAVIIDPARVAGLRVDQSDRLPPDLEAQCNGAIVVSVLLDTGVAVPVYVVGTRWDEDDSELLRRVNWVLDCLRDDLADRTQHLWRPSVTQFPDDVPVVLA